MGTKVTTKILSFLKINILLILILAAAFFVRSWKLSSYPEAIDEDEMALGYYGYTLANFGSDEYGTKFPIYFKSVGDYKYGLYSYFAAVPVSVLGLNVASTRLISVVFGTLSVLVIYFLALEVLNKKSYALASAFILAFNPMHIHFSRVAYSNILGAFFAISAVFFFVKFIKANSFKNIFFSLMFFVLSIYSYQAYRVSLPLLFVFLVFLFYKKINKRVILAAVVSIAIVFLSFLPQSSRARSQNIKTLIDTPSLVESFSEDNISGTPLLVTRAFHNKYVILGKDLLKRYLAYFDPKLLFLETDNANSRNTIPGVGLLYFIELPLVLLSLFALFKIKDSNFKFIPLILVFVAPLAAAMVVGPISTTRAIFLVYGFSLILAFGIDYLVSKFQSKYPLVIIILVFYLANFVYFYHQYTVHKIYHHAWNGDVGLEEMVKNVNKYQSNYDYIVVSRGHFMPFLFFNTTNPSDFQQKTGIFAKLIFNMPFDCPALGKEKTLYVCFGYKVPRNSRVLEVIRFRDDLPAIILLDFDGKQLGELPKRVEWMEVPAENLKLNEKDYWPTITNR